MKLLCCIALLAASVAWGQCPGGGHLGPAPIGKTCVYPVGGSPRSMTFIFCNGSTCNGDTVNVAWQAITSGSFTTCAITAGTAPSGAGVSVQITKNGSTALFSSPIALSGGATGINPSPVHTAAFTSGANVFAAYDSYTAALTGTTGSNVVVTCQ
jgi:hypothetical protein